MPEKKENNIIIIGSGNMAYAMAYLLSKVANIKQIHSSNNKTGKALAKMYRCKFVSDIKKLELDADYYCICVPDDKIALIAKKLKQVKGILIHHSGSIQIKQLGNIKNKAVLYPFQSINKETNLNTKSTTLFYTANNKKTVKDIKKLLHPLLMDKKNITDAHRLQLHLTAVFANNFINHLLSIVDELILNKDEKNLFERLVWQAVSNFENGNNFKLQTGPAVRKDLKTIKKHLNLLKNNKELKAVYLAITNSIIKKHSK